MGAMTTRQVCQRLAAMRRQKAELDLVIAALEELQRLRAARVVELVPRDIVTAAQRQIAAWDDEPPRVA